MGELSGVARRLPNPHLLIRPFLRKEAVLSSRIEGTEAEVSDLFAYESGQRSLPGLSTDAPEEDIKEVSNYVAALEYGLSRLDSLPVSIRLIRELHERLLKGVRGRDKTPGEFRKTQNWIGTPGCEISEARYVPPPVPEMDECLDSFEKFLHQEDSPHQPLVRLALIHYQFEAIHPFLDGNGRIGRLLVILLLVHWGLLPIPLLYLSAFFSRHQQDYYHLLQGVSDRGEWEEWIAFFLEGVAQQSREAAELAHSLQDLQTAWRERVTEPGASGLLAKLTDALFERPVLTIPNAATILGVTYPTAQKIVYRLESENILVYAEGTSYPKVYYAPEIINRVSIG